MDQATKWLDLSGKVVIVTGGSMGLGEKMVENLHANGATVVYADLAPNAAFSQIDGITYIKCDVTKKAEVEQLAASVVEKFGHIDGLVNNAGVDTQPSAPPEPESGLSRLPGRRPSNGRAGVRRDYQYDL